MALLLRSSSNAFKTARNASRLIPVRSFSSVEIEVEHGRGEWKTYGDVTNFKPGKFQIKTYNKLSPVGIGRFSDDLYDIRPEDKDARNAHAILLRSYKLKEEEVPNTVRAIAR